MSEILSRRDRIIPWYFVAFFAVIFIVNGIMATLAVRTQSGLVTDHPYEKGLAYNRVIAAQEAQDKLGWKAEIQATSSQLTTTLRDAKGTALPVDDMHAYFSRPTQNGLDFDVALSNGKATIALPAHGVWDVRLEAHARGHSFQKTQRIVVP